MISLVQKGRDYSEEDQRNIDKERSPKESSGRGNNPKEITTLFHVKFHTPTQFQSC
jgi:hypothetical protein